MKVQKNWDQGLMPTLANGPSLANLCKAANCQVLSLSPSTLTSYLSLSLLLSLGDQPGTRELTIREAP